MASRFKERYVNEVRPLLREKFNYENVMEIPEIKKIVVNMGLGEVVQDA